MLRQPLDTHPKAEKVQISLIKRASIAERASLMRSISNTAIELSRRAILRANPELHEDQLKIMFVGYHYGAALTESLKKYLYRKGT